MLRHTGNTTLRINKQENQTKAASSMLDGTIFRKFISLMFLALALKRYACIGFAVGLFVVFPDYLSQGWLPV